VVKPGAVVIDVGVNSVPCSTPTHRPSAEDRQAQSKAVGDCDFEAVKKGLGHHSVPGGVGPMTIAMLEGTPCARRNSR
jgi:5,10-methylene-tetrahydrofolate dehydrogenase/methenyl tetrahydrofolate cyclohydrolase